MNRVIAYIDGFNLFHGLRSTGDKSLYWLNLSLLCKNLLRPGQELVHTHYFTARIVVSGRSGAEDVRRQAVYLEALSAQPAITIHIGHFLAKPGSCRSCHVEWVAYEEKQSDVNLAVELLTDAFQDRFDTALVLSADSDLLTPILLVQRDHPNKRVVVAFPPNRSSAALKQHAPCLTIGRDKLRKSLFEDIVSSPTGFPLHRPVTWRPAARAPGGRLE